MRSAVQDLPFDELTAIRVVRDDAERRLWSVAPTSPRTHTDEHITGHRGALDIKTRASNLRDAKAC
jgi:hypothetical protein